MGQSVDKECQVVSDNRLQNFHYHRACAIVTFSSMEQRMGTELLQHRLSGTQSSIRAHDQIIENVV